MPKRYKKSFLRRMYEAALDVIKKKKVIEAKGRILAGKLNVRSKPSLQAKVVGQVRRGQIVNIINTLDDWYQIEYNGNVAYVFRKYVEVVREEKSGIITANVLNVRQQPSTESPIVGHLKKGDIVNVVQELNKWLKINYGGKEAFVYKTFVDLTDVPVELNPIVGAKKYFYQRQDLANAPLEPQIKVDLPSDYYEKIAVRTWNNYGGLIKKISEELKIDVATALSVLCVESGGHGFKNNRMIIRFENHIFYTFWGKKNQKEFNKHFKFDKSSRRNGHYFREKSGSKWEVCHTGQDMEWRVFNFAKTLDETAALKSISMGAPQVMGFNYKFIGYQSPQEMFEYFNKDIRYHLFALFDFCKYKPERIRYLQRRDFYNFAYEYNGPANPRAYQKRLLKFYRIYRDILPKHAV